MRKPKLVSFCLSIAACCCVHLPAMTVECKPVKTDSGWIQGTIQEDLSVYLGIPFAAPPVGDLRWCAPQPLTPWEGVKTAVEFAPDPYQGDGSGNVSEDCLYLNVWTSNPDPGGNLPVLVWIYGGGFSFGSTSTPVHNGEHLARKGVVLVSINYRVGTLGFLAHPELSAESKSGVSGNYGLLDQIAGLKWVQKNISAFGGDPENVTIFGESAGGISVSMLCASPEAKGLFSRAISQSGGNFGPTRPVTYPGENMKMLADAEKAGVQYLKNAGVSTIADARNLMPSELPFAWDAGVAWPIVDGIVIQGDQFEMYQNGNFNDVDILVGYNSDEGLSFSRESAPEEFVSNVKKRYGPFSNKLLQAYPVGESSVPKTARDLMRDAAFGWQTWSWALLQAKHGHSSVYYYYFDQHAPHPADSAQADHGTPHGVDVPYVFQTLDKNDSQLRDEDFEVSELISDYWTQFAKTGTPNNDHLPNWPEFSEDSRKVMIFHDAAFIGEVPSARSLEVLDSYYSWRRSEEGKQWVIQNDL